MTHHLYRSFFKIKMLYLILPKSIIFDRFIASFYVANINVAKDAIANRYLYKKSDAIINIQATLGTTNLVGMEMPCPLYYASFLYANVGIRYEIWLDVWNFYMLPYVTGRAYPPNVT